ncbi:Branched-chain amino acid transport protein (AzlD) [Franzmannia pantelleriensis]|uniref:Branched-chain amino acid transport protein (AzlD) n=1 Tax=Franzmannia pantelleriensis TaxID=48727 RepID=A0A1G9R658_9GAMM|nr:AzlD domain-containing protein [Halomonas pantelleriensis]SDM18734.1 Branched-chain amino acid transport protein (AzlD) [Halomonas pantelleriensis]
MSNALWLAVLASAAGTLLMRLLPLLWMRRRLARLDGDERLDAMPQWLSILGPMMIAAVLGVSLVPATNDATSWLATAIGVAATLVVWWRMRSLGWPIAAGVAAYGAVVVLIALATP